MQGNGSLPPVTSISTACYTQSNQPGDTGQEAPSGGRDQHVLLDEEDVGGVGPEHEPFHIQHHRIGRTGNIRLDLGYITYTPYRSGVPKEMEGFYKQLGMLY